MLWFLYLLAGIVFDKNSAFNASELKDLESSICKLMLRVRSFLNVHRELKPDMFSFDVLKRLKKIERTSTEKLLLLKNDIE